MPSPFSTLLFDVELLQFTPSLEEQCSSQPEFSAQQHSQQSFDNELITINNPQLPNDEHESTNTLASTQWPLSTNFSFNYHQAIPDTRLSNRLTWTTDAAACCSNHQNHLLSRCESRNSKTKRSLSKDEIQLLETEFKRNSKPSATTKRALAEQVNVHYARINVRCQIAQAI